MKSLLKIAADGVGIPMLAGIVDIYAAVQFIQGWLLEPIILVPQVRINPLSTVLALVVKPETRRLNRVPV